MRKSEIESQQKEEWGQKQEAERNPARASG